MKDENHEYDWNKIINKKNLLKSYHEDEELYQYRASLSYFYNSLSKEQVCEKVKHDMKLSPEFEFQFMSWFYEQEPKSVENIVAWDYEDVLRFLQHSILTKELENYKKQ